MKHKPVLIFKDYCEFLSQVRSYFLSQGFLETPTPTLVSCPGMEAHLDPIMIQDGEYLPTSPEIHLKRLLCMGLEQIFEIRPCFRQDPETDRHLREFTMLEWYRANGDLNSLIVDIGGLISHLKNSGFWSESTELKKHSFPSLFEDHLNFKYRPDTTEGELKQLLKSKGIHFDSTDSKTDLIHRLLIEVFEPSFKGWTLLTEFPPEMAILSRIGPKGFAERFELFFNDMELANAFFEVTDPALQRQRWEKDVEERLSINAKRLKPDEGLLKDMESLGLPVSSGIALGLDRLFMVCRGLKDIREIRPF